MPKLRSIAGEHLGKEFPLTAETPLLIGRRDSNAVVLTHSKTSRSHAEVKLQNGRCLARDLNSSNGTYVNGIKLDPAQPKELGPGDELRVAETILRYFEDDTELPKINIPGHTLVEVIAQGGMGTIYRARQNSMDRDVAAKVLSQKYSGRKEFVNRFIQEARAAGKLSHPNIIQVHNVGKTDDNHYYFTMELVNGANLTQRMANREALTVEDIVNTAIHVSDALEYAHNNGIIHRDIKPDNIIISNSGEVKLADLGIAKLGDMDDSADGKKSVLGTPHYMSPEQASGKRVDHRTDLYSLGATLFHVFSGEPVFDSANSTEVMAMHVRKEPQPLAKITPDVPEPICAVVDKLLCKNPADRYQSAPELRHALEAALEASRKNPKVESRPPTMKPRPRTETRAMPGSKQRNSNNAAAQLLVFGGIAVVVIVAGVFLMGDNGTTTRNTTGGNTTPAAQNGPAKALAEAEALVRQGNDAAAKAKYQSICTAYAGAPDVVREAQYQIKQIDSRLYAATKEAEKKKSWDDYLDIKRRNANDQSLLRQRLEKIRRDFPGDPELSPKIDEELASLNRIQNDNQQSLFASFETDFNGKMARKDYDAALATVDDFSRKNPDHPRSGELGQYRNKVNDAAKKEIDAFQAEMKPLLEKKLYTNVIRKCNTFLNDIKYAAAREPVVALKAQAESEIAKTYSPVESKVYESLLARDFLGAANTINFNKATFVNTPFQNKLAELETTVSGMQRLYENTVARINEAGVWKVPDSYNIPELKGMAISGANSKGLKVKIGMGERPLEWDKLSAASMAKIYQRYTPPSAAEDLKYAKLFEEKFGK